MKLPRTATDYAVWWSWVSEPAEELAHFLRQHLGDEEAYNWVMRDTFTAPPASEWMPCSGPESHVYWERWKARSTDDSVFAEADRFRQQGGILLTPSDEAWPQALNDLGNRAPHVLWVKGSISNGPRVSIVGSRITTPIGRTCAQDLGAELSDRKVSVVSGGAIGIDTYAHRGSLYGQTPGMAVLAGGHHQIYPQSNSGLFDELLEAGGAIVTEMSLNARPAKWRFLARNRLIAAMSDVTVVVEAGYRSGALNTARWALEIGRTVGAVPGSIDAEYSMGTNELIRNGAYLIRHATDILELMPGVDVGKYDIQKLLFGNPVEVDSGTDALPPIQRRVWEALSPTKQQTAHEVASVAGLGITEVQEALVELSLAGYLHKGESGWKRCRRSAT